MYSYTPKLKYYANPKAHLTRQKLLYLYNNRNEIIDGLPWGEFKAICECPNRKAIIKYWIGKSSYKYRNGVCYA